MSNLVLSPSFAKSSQHVLGHAQTLLEGQKAIQGWLIEDRPPDEPKGPTC